MSRVKNRYIKDGLDMHDLNRMQKQIEKEAHRMKEHMCHELFELLRRADLDSLDPEYEYSGSVDRIAYDSQTVELPDGRWKPISKWRLEINGNEFAVPITYCPFCSVKLERWE